MYSQSNKHTVNLLLDHGADINIQDKSGFTILIELVRYNQIDEIKYVLENTNIDIYIKDDNNITAYDRAIVRKHDKTKELLDDYMNSSLDIKCALD